MTKRRNRGRERGEMVQEGGSCGEVGWGYTKRCCEKVALEVGHASNDMPGKCGERYPLHDNLFTSTTFTSPEQFWPKLPEKNKMDNALPAQGTSTQPHWTSYSCSNSPSFMTNCYP